MVLTKTINPMKIKVILILFISSLLPLFLSASIVLDNSSTAKTIDKKHLMWWHTTNAGDNRILVIGITNGSDRSVSSITYNGDNLTEGGSILQNSMRTSLWYLVAPDVGNHKIKITLSFKADIFAGANTYTGVDQTNPWGSFVTDSGKSSNANTTVSASTDQLAIDVVGLIAANPTSGSDQNLQHKIGGSLYNASSNKTGASSVTMSWTHTEEDWGIVAAPLNAASILPVELLYFSAKPHKHTNVELVWSTAEEINNEYFTIERSKDGLLWEFVNDIESKGNGNTILQYTEYDKDPFWGQSYYRLKQTDFDGTFQYSEIASVELQEPQSKILAYPNPVTHGNDLNISINLPINLEEARVDFINSSGIVVQTIVWNNLLAGYSILNTSTNNLSEGFYNVRISSPEYFKPIFTNIIVARLR
jgi:hypothetical protein